MIKAQLAQVETWTGKRYEYINALITRTNLGVLVGGEADSKGGAKEASKWFPLAMIKEIRLNGKSYDFKIKS